MAWGIILLNWPTHPLSQAGFRQKRNAVCGTERALVQGTWSVRYSAPSMRRFTCLRRAVVVLVASVFVARLGIGVLAKFM